MDSNFCFVERNDFHREKSKSLKTRSKQKDWKIQQQTIWIALYAWRRYEYKFGWKIQFELQNSDNHDFNTFSIFLITLPWICPCWPIKRFLLSAIVTISHSILINQFYWIRRNIPKLLLWCTSLNGVYMLFTWQREKNDNEIESEMKNMKQEKVKHETGGEQVDFHLPSLRSMWNLYFVMKITNTKYNTLTSLWQYWIPTALR